MKRIVLACGALVFCLAGGPAAAADMPTRVVEYADLNLSSETGRNQLERRIRSAIRFVCDDKATTKGLAVRQIANKCLRETTAKTTPMVEIAISNYTRRSGRLARLEVARTSE